MICDNSYDERQHLTKHISDVHDSYYKNAFLKKSQSKIPMNSKLRIPFLPEKAKTAQNDGNKKRPYPCSFCDSGSAADTQAMTDIVKNQLEWYEIEFGNPPPVHTAAHLFKNISYDYRDQLTAGLIIAGWDKDNGGQVYSVPIGGALMRQAASIGGSGSTYLYGFVDANYKKDMKKDECVELAKKAVTLAINRDGSSGGCCRIAIITKDGVERKLFLNNELDAIGEFSY